MDINCILPFLVFFPMAGGVIGYVIGRKSKAARDNWACAVTFMTWIAVFLLFGKGTAFTISNVFSLGIHFDGEDLRIVLCFLAAFAWFMTTVFSKEYFAHYRNRNRYYLFMQLTLGATLGVFLSADLFTALIFFEIMSFTSFVLVIHDETRLAVRAAQTYLTVAVIGGLVTLMGLFMMYSMAGTLDMNALAEFVAMQEDKSSVYAVGVLILFGFAAKAGLFPMHIWLPEAHPVAPAPASALLSCILTKSGVFGMIVLGCKIFLYDAVWGHMMLALGAITMSLGAFLALFSANLKRILACSSLSQIGFIAVAIGMQGLLADHNGLAANGTILHVVNHSLLKLLLFMAAGVIYMNTHQLHLNDIRGWGKDKPLLKGIFFLGCWGIACLPLGNGYISKTLIHESIVEYIQDLQVYGDPTSYIQGIEYLFLLSGGLTLAYMMKIFVAVFMEKNPNTKTHTGKNAYMTKTSATVLLICALFVPILGSLPYMTMDKIADISRDFMGAYAPGHAVYYFAWINLKGAVITLVVGLFVYFLFIRKVLMGKDENGNMIYVERWPEWLNLENRLYRPLLLSWLPYIGGFAARVLDSFVDGVISVARILIFNDDSGRVVPPEDRYFSTYHDDGEKVVYREGFARSLLLIGIGLAVAMLYILI